MQEIMWVVSKSKSRGRLFLQISGVNSSRSRKYLTKTESYLFLVILRELKLFLWDDPWSCQSQAWMGKGNLEWWIRYLFLIFLQGQFNQLAWTWSKCFGLNLAHRSRIACRPALISYTSNHFLIQIRNIVNSNTSTFLLTHYN